MPHLNNRLIIKLLPAFLLVFAMVSVFAGEPEKDTKSGYSSGELVLPGETDEQQEDKKCITVCERWGKDCIINPRTGNRKCRRVCKELGQECFDASPASR
jgi:hypothetical protein